MKTIFDKEVRESLLHRINMLNERSVAQWGKMNVYQMVKHCRLWDEMILQNKPYKQAFIGKLFGKIALKKVMKDDAPLARNTPTLPVFVIKEAGNVSEEIKKWLLLVDQYGSYATTSFLHPFFGKIDREQVGYMAYKHADHHLRQFGC